MPRRSPARFLAPLALVAVTAALVVVVSGGRGGDDETPAQAPSSSVTRTSDGNGSDRTEKRRRARKVYIVKPGDTPSAIAEKMGVPLARIEELNPDIDPQLLSPGDKIRLEP